ncbi:MAG: hypothetical protein HW407_1560 [Bacteroidetes bacterium]|nr:hypothetical protein [Bacteroidota bacterium]
MRHSAAGYLAQLLIGTCCGLGCFICSAFGELDNIEYSSFGAARKVSETFTMAGNDVTHCTGGTCERPDTILKQCAIGGVVNVGFNDCRVDTEFLSRASPYVVALRERCAHAEPAESHR